MHTGSRAFCFLMALAATGAECASAATPVAAPDAGHYRVEAKLVNDPRASTDKADETLPAVVVANHVLAVIAVSHTINPPNGNEALSGINLKVRPNSDGSFQVAFTRSLIYADSLNHANNTSFRPSLAIQQIHASVAQTSNRYHVFSLPPYAKPNPDFGAGGRALASLADANARQLLFVKITRG